MEKLPNCRQERKQVEFPPGQGSWARCEGNGFPPGFPPLDLHAWLPWFLPTWLPAIHRSLHCRQNVDRHGRPPVWRRLDCRLLTAVFALLHYYPTRGFPENLPPRTRLGWKNLVRKGTGFSVPELHLYPQITVSAQPWGCL